MTHNGYPEVERKSEIHPLQFEAHPSDKPGERIGYLSIISQPPGEAGGVLPLLHGAPVGHDYLVKSLGG